MTHPTSPQDREFSAQLQAVATDANNLPAFLAVTAAFCGVRASRKPTRNVKKGQ